MEIREYEKRDASRIEEIYNSARMDEFIGAEGNFYLVPWGEDEHTLNEFPDSNVYVCELEGVVGFCGFKKNHISWLFVDPAERNKGVASLLLDHGLRPAKRSSPFIVKFTSILFAVSFFAMCVSVISELYGGGTIVIFPNKAIEWCGFLLGILGITTTVYSQYQMGQEWRIGVDEKELTDLVEHGIYSRIRNPIYTGVLVFCAGLVLLHPGLVMLVSFICVFISIDLHVRLVEEPHLRRLHGTRFAAYKETTGSYLPSWRGGNGPNKGM